MPQLNSDEAANDEPKTYHDEAIDGSDGWQDSKDLNDIKGDLVSENDNDRLYDNNQTSSHRNKDKHDFDQDHCKDTRDAVHNFEYPQHDVESMLPRLGHTLFQNSFLLPSLQTPYSSYMNSLLYGGTPSVDVNRKQGAHYDIPSMCAFPGHAGQISPNPLAAWPPNPLHSLCTASALAGVLRYPYPLHNFSSAPGAIRSMPYVSPHSDEIYRKRGHPECHLPSHVINRPDFKEKPLVIKKTVNSVSTKPHKSKHPYVKKPLNAFMIFMKEQRAQVVSECTLKESAAINQILGRKWHNLDRTEQQKYYEMAQKERQAHMELFPGWSARENYGKRKRRKKEKAHECPAQNVKKCRAVFGLEEQQSWCAPCRRKKRCVRYQQDGDDSDDDQTPCQYSIAVPSVSSDKLQLSDHPSNHASMTGLIKQTRVLPKETLSDDIAAVSEVSPAPGNIPVSNSS